MRNIINLTQHPASAEQVTAGVIDLQGENLSKLKVLLTFEKLPSIIEIEEKAEMIAQLAKGYKAAMIGGAPYLMASLGRALSCKGIASLYAFSARVSVEEALPDGSTRKTQVFRHLGFVDGEK